MKVDIRSSINCGRILRERGLGGSKEAQKFLAATVAKYCDEYVPFSSGTLKNTVEINTDNIRYNQPYAHYQYIGEVMAGRAPKRYAGRPLNSNGIRGKQWDKRMMADKGRNVRESLARYVGGKAE